MQTWQFHVLLPSKYQCNIGIGKSSFISINNLNISAWKSCWCAFFLLWTSFCVCTECFTAKRLFMSYYAVKKMTLPSFIFVNFSLFPNQCITFLRVLKTSTTHLCGAASRFSNTRQTCCLQKWAVDKNYPFFLKRISAEKAVGIQCPMTGKQGN